MRQDEELRQAVIDALEMEPMLEANRIGVAVANGVATLSGKVAHYNQKLLAERVAQRVPGVKGIAEDLMVDLPGVSQRTDADICQAVLSALKWDVTVPDEKIKAKVEDGQVILSGTVSYGYQKSAAEEAVGKLLGVRGIINAIAIESGARPEEIKDEIDKSFRRNMERELSTIRVEASDGVATLKGSVRSWVEREDAAKAARSVPGVAFVENRLVVKT
jgi:osmotically-inducible protein OsmY